MPVTRSQTRRRSKRLSQVSSRSKTKKSGQKTSKNTKKSTKNSRNSNDVDVSDIKGDTATQYTVGDIVWAKFENYPWWPGRIIKPAKGRSLKKGSIIVHWFGDFDGREDACTRRNIVPFTTRYASAIQKSVTRADGAIFKSSLQQARAAMTELREERGYEGALTPEPEMPAPAVSPRRRSLRLNDSRSAASTEAKSGRVMSVGTRTSRKRRASEARDTDSNSGQDQCEMPEETTAALNFILQTHSAEDLSPFVYHMYHACTAKLSTDDALEVTAAAYGITTDNCKYHMECYTNDS